MYKKWVRDAGIIVSKGKTLIEIRKLPLERKVEMELGEYAGNPNYASTARLQDKHEQLSETVSEKEN